MSSLKGFSDKESIIRVILHQKRGWCFAHELDLGSLIGRDRLPIEDGVFTPSWSEIQTFNRHPPPPFALATISVLTHGVRRESDR